ADRQEHGGLVAGVVGVLVEAPVRAGLLRALARLDGVLQRAVVVGRQVHDPARRAAAGGVERGQRGTGVTADRVHDVAGRRRALGRRLAQSVIDALGGV